MPFAGDMTATANGSLTLSIAAALLYLLLVQQPPLWRRTVAKTGSIVLLGVVSYTAGGPLLLTLALMASASGDAALAAEEERWFLPGLVAFLIAHLLYVALFTTGGTGIGVLWDEAWRSVWALLVLVAARALLVPLLRAVPPAMRLPIVFYTLAIVAMGVMALTLPGYAVAIGATLFIASDAILAIRKYLLPETSPHATWAGYAVWVLYYAAQLTITLAIVA